MDQILDRLFLGNFEDAERVTAIEVQCVLTLCERLPCIAQTIVPIHAPIPDEVYLPPSVWGELVHVLQIALRDYAAVLVHCRLGVSRSPTLVAAHLARMGMTIESALAMLVSRRSIVAPHAETWRGCVEWAQK